MLILSSKPIRAWRRHMDSNDILNFWFVQLEPKDWFQGGTALDDQVRDQFWSVLRQARAGELWPWRKSAEGRLAEIIVLDQFSRNIYRGQAQAFDADPQALVLAQEAIHAGADQWFNDDQKSFLYMPFMHSESALIQERGLQLFSAKGLEKNYAFALAHQKIIERFGRFPHRNAQLGRHSSAEELAFLQEPGSSF